MSDTEKRRIQKDAQRTARTSSAPSRGLGPLARYLGAEQYQEQRAAEPPQDQAADQEPVDER